MIGNCLIAFRIKRLVCGALLAWATTTAAAQQSALSLEEEIGVVVRPGTDSVTLRWAPLSLQHWITANQYGYTIERFTLVHNDQVVQPPEKRLLTTVPMKPLPEDAWEKFVGNAYGMVAAQALYGETFALDLSQSGVTQIVNKARENEQRFSMALFCADMSPAVAQAQALYWSDMQVEKNVKYLYRISVYTPTDTLRGSAYIAPDQKYQLPPVQEVQAEAKGQAVNLRWNQQRQAQHYVTYIVERAEEEGAFARVTDVPGVTLNNPGQNNKYQYAADTIPSIEKMYHYRVLGLTPFGEYGPPSDTVSVRGTRKLKTSQVFINQAVSPDNQTVNVGWEFPEAENAALQGFSVTRAPNTTGPYKPLHKDLLPASTRAFKDLTPSQANYYIVKAVALDGTTVASLPYLAMLVDSIPPAVPAGLAGKVDDHGRVTISWKPNTDPDIYGYRIYRAYYKNDEFAQLTSAPLKDTTLTDQVELQSLNENIHYRVMAIDKNQNHSGLSEILTLALPDKVPPMPPVWLPASSSKNGVKLSWQPSGSPDVVTYELYRKGEQDQWMRVKTMNAGTDSVYTYTDENLRNGRNQYYIVIAIDEAGLESEPTPVQTGFKVQQMKPPVEMTTPVVDRTERKIVLQWTYEQPNVTAYRVYRKAAEGPLQLYRTLKEPQFTDTALVPDTQYSYQVMAVFTDGAFSAMTDEVQVKF